MRKTITVLLALVMALVVVPISVWANDDVAKTDDGKTYATLEEAVRSVKNGGTVTLLKNATGGGIGTYKIPSNTDAAIAAKSFTIDFGGYTYTVSDPAKGSKGYESQGFHFEWSGDENNNHSITMMNGTVQVAENTQNVKMLVQNYCNLTLKNIKLDGTNLVQSDVGYYTLSNCCGKVVIDNSTIIAHEGGVAFDVDGNRSRYNDSPVTLSVENGSVIEGKIEVSKGNNLLVKDGSFTDLATAFRYATDKATIKMAADVTTASQLEVAQDKDITLNMNGKTLKYVGAGYLSSGVIAVHNGGTLSVSGNGTIDCGEFNTTGAMAAITVTVKGDDANKVAKLVIENGTFLGNEYGISGNGTRSNTDITINGGKVVARTVPKNNKVDSTAIYNPQIGKLTINGGEFEGFNSAVEIRSGEMVINDGIFTSTATAEEIKSNGNGGTMAGVAIAIAQHQTKNDIDVKINGGTFNGIHALKEANPEKNADAAKQVTLAIAGGAFNGKVDSEDVTAFISGGTFKSAITPEFVAADREIVKNTDGTFSVGKIAPVAKIGDAEYNSLEAAIAAAKDGDTVVLQKDTTVNDYVEVKKAITVDLGGKKITSLGGGFDVYANLTVKNGKMETVKWAAWVQGGAALVVEKDVTIKTTSTEANKGGITVQNNGSSVTMFGKIESAGGAAISGIGNKDDGGVTINIEEGAVVTNTNANGLGIYYPNTAELNIKGGTISGATGVYVKSGKTVVTGGTIIGNGAKEDYKYFGNGGNSTGNALVVDTCGYPGGDPVVEIKGGSFESVNNDAVGSYAHGENKVALTGFISGGTFNTDPSDFVADGFEAKADKEGKFAVQEKGTEKPEEKPETKPDGGKNTPKTYDAGIAIYGVSVILSVTGMAWMGLKKRK